MSEDTKTNREEKFVSLWEKRKLFYKTQIYKNQLITKLWMRNLVHALRILTQMQPELLVAMLLASIIMAG